jgi:hypothetical protein
MKVRDIEQALLLEDFRPIKEYESLVETLFDVLARDHTRYEARRIFTKYARPTTKRDAQLHNSARMLWRYISMKPKRNVALLARELAKEDGSNRHSIAQHIWRAVNPKTAYGKKVQEYLREDLFERGVTVRTVDDNGKTEDILVGDILDAGLTLDDVLSKLELEVSLRDIFD